MDFPGNCNLHEKIERLHNEKLYKPEMDILLANSSIDEVEEIKLRDWFPVYHCGYFAVIGFTVPTNDFIMSEPIIFVDEKGRYLRGPKRYYQLEGQFSITTYEMFDLNLNFDCSVGLNRMCRDLFVDGLRATWYQDVHLVTLVIADTRYKDINGYKTHINDTFDQIVNPHANHYVVDKSDAIINMKIGISKTFELLLTKKPWRSCFIKHLRSNGYSHLVEKITKYPPMNPPQNRIIDRRTVKWLYLWTPEKRDENLSNFYIKGKIFDDNHRFIDFSSRILFVDSTGPWIVTESGVVQLKGPLCGLIYEKYFNLAAVNYLMLKLIFNFSFGLPCWRDMLTIIDVVLRMDICAFRPERIGNSQTNRALID